MIRKFFLGTLFSLISLWAIAQNEASDPTVIFQVANKAYMDKNYAEAITAYEELLAMNQRSADLYYNLGSAYLQLKKIGPAVLYLERAQLYQPGDPDIAHNLGLARYQLEDDISEIPEFFLTRWWRQLALLASVNVWGIFGLLLLGLGAGGLVLWQIGPTRSKRKMGFLGGTTLMLLGLIPVLLSFSRITLEKKSPFAIIQALETPLHTAPDEKSQNIFDLHEGTKVEILDEIEEWYKVRLLNGDQGWLPETVLERI